MLSFIKSFTHDSAMFHLDVMFQLPFHLDPNLSIFQVAQNPFAARRAALGQMLMTHDVGG